MDLAKVSELVESLNRLVTTQGAELWEARIADSEGWSCDLLEMHEYSARVAGNQNGLLRLGVEICRAALVPSGNAGQESNDRLTYLGIDASIVLAEVDTRPSEPDVAETVKPFTWKDQAVLTASMAGLWILGIVAFGFMIYGLYAFLESRK